MKLFKRVSKCPHYQLYFFIYGSIVFLLVCLMTTAAVLSETYLGKERERAANYSRYIKDFFDFEYSNISQQMWGHAYEGVHNRVKGIARELGQEKYGLVLASPEGKCVYSFDSKGSTQTANIPCELSAKFKEQIPLFQPAGSNSLIAYDPALGRYVYMIPLYVGVILQGYLYASIADPYDYYRGSTWILISKFFLAPISSVVLAWLIWLLLSHRFVLAPYLAHQVAKERKEALGELAGAVAHNIRAPLVALHSVVQSIKGIDARQRRLLNLVSSRIENIANELLTEFTVTKNVAGTESFSFLSMVIDAMIAERVAVLGERTRIEIKTDLPNELMSVGVPLASHEISSILSNLLQNSIQAVQKDQPGMISISGVLKNNRVLLIIRDNGIGMPDDILERLRSVGGSYGKSGGVGLGLKHAKLTLAKIGGTLSIESSFGVGTQVTLEMPLAELPKWYPPSLDASRAKTIVVLEDDESVTLLWKERLGEHAIYLTDPADFDIKKYPVESSFYILDYEITDSHTTGLDLIQKHRLGKKAVLATSYFNDSKIQKSIEEAGSSMIPKFMIPSIDIVLPQKGLGPPSKKCDLVLIDDDHLVHELWQFDALTAQRSVKAVGTLEALDLSELDTETPIYIDKNLANGVSGFEVAKSLHESGFSNLYIATGDRVDPTEVPTYIKAVRNKTFPFKTAGTANPKSLPAEVGREASVRGDEQRGRDQLSGPTPRQLTESTEGR